MAKGKNQKLKLLLLLEILKKESDDENKLSTNYLIEKLNQNGISVERKTLYQDIKLLKDFGYDILIDKEKSNKYSIVHEPFDLAELKILCDAVKSSKFITKNKTQIIIKKLASLAGIKSGEILKRDILCYNSIKHSNESIFYNADTIIKAIVEKKKISFFYFDYGKNKEIIYRNNRKTYLINPIELVYTNDNYYLVCYDDKHNCPANYRVDKMINIIIKHENITYQDFLENFDINKYCNQLSNMYTGPVTRVSLLAHNSIMNQIIDKFGEEIYIKEEDKSHFSITVDVQKGPTFFAWCFTFKEKLQILSPENIVEEMKDMLTVCQNEYFSNNN